MLFGFGFGIVQWNLYENAIWMCLVESSFFPLPCFALFLGFGCEKTELGSPCIEVGLKLG